MMMSSRYIADRRAHLRFQILGGLTCTLLSSEPLTILNLGTSGVLVETSVSLPVNAELEMQLVLPTHVSDATVKVRRVTSVGAGHVLRYHIGLEFLAITEEAEDVIRRLVAAAGAVC
jgi:hypothetical protein